MKVEIFVEMSNEVISYIVEDVLRVSYISDHNEIWVYLSDDEQDDFLVFGGKHLEFTVS